jgi:hypothetical protein
MNYVLELLRGEMERSMRERAHIRYISGLGTEKDTRIYKKLSSQISALKEAINQLELHY